MDESIDQPRLAHNARLGRRPLQKKEGYEDFLRCPALEPEGRSFFNSPWVSKGTPQPPSPFCRSCNHRRTDASRSSPIAISYASRASSAAPARANNSARAAQYG